MSILQEKLANGQFAITAEMAPPKGCDFTEQLEVAELLKGKVDAVNVTDMQSACLKASSLGLCIKLQQAGIDAIVQMTGRDRNRMAIMGDVLSASAFGINTVLALTGDHPTVGDCKESKPVYDLDSVGILKMLTEMEGTGTDCGGNPLSATPKLFKGAVVTPVYDPLPLQISKLKKKVAAGAQFIQTQGIFDMDSLKHFMQEVRAAGITVPIMAGIIPLKTAGMAKFMNANVPGIQVPEWMIERLTAAAEEGKERGVKGLPMQAGIDMAAEFIAQIKAEKVCEGVHIMAIGAEQNVPEILKRAGI
jgi:5,10-methylenetetrahydrofolate reductase